jgi:hypothetical protein
MLLAAITRTRSVEGEGRTSGAGVPADAKAATDTDQAVIAESVR